MIGEFLRRLSAALELTGVPYMLTGSVASSMYGLPRATNDVDMVIAPTRQQLLSLVQLFQRVGLTVAPEDAAAALKSRTQFNVIDFANGWKADFILCKDRQFSLGEFERRATHEVEGLRLTIATPEDVILAKLEWAKIGESELQLSDAAGILSMQGEELDLAYIERWVERLDLGNQWKAARDRAR